MVVNETDIRKAISEQRRRAGLQPLEPRAMNDAVSEMIHYALMLDEVGRSSLLSAFESGQIDMDEFKRRAHRNEPNGGFRKRQPSFQVVPKPRSRLTLSS